MRTRNVAPILHWQCSCHLHVGGDWKKILGVFLALLAKMPGVFLTPTEKFTGSFSQGNLGKVVRKKHTTIISFASAESLSLSAEEITSAFLLKRNARRTAKTLAAKVEIFPEECFRDIEEQLLGFEETRVVFSRNLSVVE